MSQKALYYTTSAALTALGYSNGATATIGGVAYTFHALATGSGTISLPSDWPGTADRADVWGGGATGNANGGGGGGACSSTPNLTISGSAVSMSLGGGGVGTSGAAGGDTWLVSNVTLLAKGAPGLSGGSSTGGYGTTKHSGGASAVSSGGGGAATISADGGNSPSGTGGSSGSTPGSSSANGLSSIEGGSGGGFAYFSIGGYPGGGAGTAHGGSPNGGDGAIRILYTPAAANPPTTTTSPTISPSTATVGTVFTVTQGVYTNSPTITRQWQRYDGSTVTAISGATGTTYTATSADLNKSVRCMETATNGAGSVQAYTVFIPVSNNSVAPVLSGTAQVGSAIHLSQGTWYDVSGGVTYTIGAVDSYSSPTVEVVFNASDVTLPATGTNVFNGQTVSLVGLYLIGQVTGKDSSGTSSTAYSNGLGPITAAASPPVSTAAPTISGTQAGATWTCSTGSWANSPTGYAYQWSRNGSPVSGATTSSFTPTNSDHENAISITCTVTASNTAGSASATSAGLIPTAATPPTNTAVNTVTGTFRVGQSITTTSGTWSPTPAGYSYTFNIFDASYNYIGDASSGSNTTTVPITAEGYYIQATVTPVDSSGWGYRDASNNSVYCATGLLGPVLASETATVAASTKKLGAAVSAAHGLRLTASSTTKKLTASATLYRAPTAAVAGATKKLSAAATVSHKLTAIVVGSTKKLAATATVTGPALWTPTQLGTAVAMWIDHSSGDVLNGDGTVGGFSNKGSAAMSSWVSNGGQNAHVPFDGLDSIACTGSTGFYSYNGNNVVFGGTSCHVIGVATLGNYGDPYGRFLSASPPNTQQDYSLTNGLNVARQNGGASWWCDFGGVTYGYGNSPGGYDVPFIWEAEISALSDGQNSSFQTWQNGQDSYGVQTVPGSANFQISEVDECCRAGDNDKGGGVRGESLWITRTLTADETSRLQGYLAWKWGLQAKLPANHPYVAGAPVVAPTPATDTLSVAASTKKLTSSATVSHKVASTVAATTKKLTASATVSAKSAITVSAATKKPQATVGAAVGDTISAQAVSKKLSASASVQHSAAASATASTKRVQAAMAVAEGASVAVVGGTRKLQAQASCSLLAVDAGSVSGVTKKLSATVSAGVGANAVAAGSTKKLGGAVSAGLGESLTDVSGTKKLQASAQARVGASLQGVAATRKTTVSAIVGEGVSTTVAAATRKATASATATSAAPGTLVNASTKRLSATAQAEVGATAAAHAGTKKVTGSAFGVVIELASIVGATKKVAATVHAGSGETLTDGASTRKVGATVTACLGATAALTAGTKKVSATVVAFRAPVASVTATTKKLAAAASLEDGEGLSSAGATKKLEASVQAEVGANVIAIGGTKRVQATAAALEGTSAAISAGTKKAAGAVQAGHYLGDLLTVQAGTRKVAGSAVLAFRTIYGPGDIARVAPDVSIVAVDADSTVALVARDVTIAVAA